MKTTGLWDPWNFFKNSWKPSYNSFTVTDTNCSYSPKSLLNPPRTLDYLNPFSDSLMVSNVLKDKRLRPPIRNHRSPKPPLEHVLSPVTRQVSCWQTADFWISCWNPAKHSCNAFRESCNVLQESRFPLKDSCHLSVVKNKKHFSQSFCTVAFIYTGIHIVY